MQADNQNQDINTQVTVLADILTGLVTDKKLADKQQEELLQQYREDVDNVRAHYNKGNTLQSSGHTNFQISVHNFPFVSFSQLHSVQSTLYTWLLQQ